MQRSILNNQIFKIFFLLFLIHSLQATQFYPIQAGSLIIEKKDFYTNQQAFSCIQRIIKLETSLIVFEYNENITILSGISSVNLDQNLGIQFVYQLDTFNNQKIVRYKISKKNQIIMTDEFFMQIDFIIGQNIRVGRLNMTSFQQHIQNVSLNQQQKNQSNKEVHNELFLFLNGFSSINITNSVMYSYIYSYDMYVIHYMTDKGDQLQQGWINKKYFIMFSSLFLPKYPYGIKSCKSVMKSHQKQSFIYECEDKEVITYFFGLAGFNSTMINAQFQLFPSGFTFKVKQKTNFSTYGIYAFPLKVNPRFKFIDNRNIKKMTNESDVHKYQIIVLGLVVFLIFCIWMILKYFQKNKKESKQKKTDKDYQNFQDEKQVGSIEYKPEKKCFKQDKVIVSQKKIETQYSELQVQQF